MDVHQCALQCSRHLAAIRSAQGVELVTEQAGKWRVAYIDAGKVYRGLHNACMPNVGTSTHFQAFEQIFGVLVRFSRPVFAVVVEVKKLHFSAMEE
eukprot:2055229-Pleurochrysis_carterae.AAC.2